MERVIIESPYHASTEEGIQRNLDFARRCCLAAVRQGLNPFASHLYYTQFLDDSIPEERDLGIQLGFDMGRDAREFWFCLRRGEVMSRGMLIAYRKHAHIRGRHIQWVIFDEAGKTMLEIFGKEAPFEKIAPLFPNSNPHV